MDYSVYKANVCIDFVLPSLNIKLLPFLFFLFFLVFFYFWRGERGLKEIVMVKYLDNLLKKWHRTRCVIFVLLFGPCMKCLYYK